MMTVSKIIGQHTGSGESDGNLCRPHIKESQQRGTLKTLAGLFKGSADLPPPGGTDGSCRNLRTHEKTMPDLFFQLLILN